MDQLLQYKAIDQTQLSALPDVWASILNKIDSQPLSRAALGHRVIGWVAHAERPLKIAEIQHAFLLENDCDRIEEQKLLSVETLLEVCHGLVALDDGDSTLNLLNPSAYEFFRRMPRKFEAFQEDIARTCLEYLCLHDIQQCFSSREFETMTNTMRQEPFLAYAAQYWGKHAQRVEQQVGAPIRRLLDDHVLRSGSFQALQNLESEDLGLDHDSLQPLPVEQSPLSIAAYWNLTLTARDILVAGGNPSSADSRGSTPLHWASRNGHTSMVQLLLSYDPSLDMQDWRGWTPLFCAVFSRDVGIVLLLLEKYADHLLLDIIGWNVLHWAVSTGKEETVRALLAYHRDFLAREKPVEILIKDITVGQAREIERYSGKKPVSDDGHPIEIAARGHNIVIFDILLQDIAEYGEHRVRAEETWPREQLNEELQSFNSIWSSKEFDPQMSNALSKMTKREMLRIDYYLEQPLVPKDLYSIALHLAIRDENMMAAPLLLELGADVNFIIAKTRRAPLHTAAFRKDPEFARILLQNGANPMLTDHFGRTPLHQAILNGFEKTAEVLIEHGSDVNVGTTVETTSLMLACGLDLDENNDQKIPLRLVKTLLAHGASATLRDKKGRTALHLAIYRCEYEIVRELIVAGADVNAKDSSQLTVLHYLAKRHGHERNVNPRLNEDILDLLLEHCGEGIESKTNLNWEQEINSAIVLAILEQNWSSFQTLVRKRTKAPLPTAEALGLLSVAVHACQPAAVQFLLDQGAIFDIDEEKSILGTVIEYLRSTIPERIQDLAKLLKILPTLSTNVNATICDGYHVGMAALLVAAKKLDSAQAIQLLIDAGADIYQCDDYGQDSFFLAAIRKQQMALRCLIENKSKRPLAKHWLQVPDSHLLSALPDDDLEDLVCSSLRDSNLLEIRNETGKTPLQTAVTLGNTSMVRKLLAQGADLETRDCNGWTPLHNAVHSARWKDDTIIDILLEANADVSAATELWGHQNDARPSGLYGWCEWTGQALHLAAMFGRVRLVKLLLERGADVHASTGTEGSPFPGHGPTALFIAMDTVTFYDERVREELDESRLRIAEMLIERGAVVDGVVDRLNLDHVLKFAGFEELWEKLRVGISQQRPHSCRTFLYRKRLTDD